MKNNVKAISTLVKNIFRNAALENPVIIFITVSLYLGYTFFSFNEIANNFSGLKITSLTDLYEKFYTVFFLFYFNNLIYLSIIIFLSTIFLYSKVHNIFKKYPITIKNIFMMSLFTVMLCMYILIMPSVIFNIILISSDVVMFAVILIVLAIFYLAFVLCYVASMQLMMQFLQLIIKKFLGKVYFWSISFLSIIPFVVLIINKRQLSSVEQVPVRVFLVIHIICAILWYKWVNVRVMLPVKSSKVTLNIDKIKMLPASILNTLLIIIRNRVEFTLSMIVVVFYLIFSSPKIGLFSRSEHMYFIIPFLLIALGMMNVYLNWYRRVAKKLYQHTNVILLLLVVVITMLLALFTELSLHYYISLVLCIAVILKFKLTYNPDKINSLTFMLVLSMLSMILLGVIHVVKL